MLDVLTNLTFRKLFAAQVIALLGTGLATVALALLAYDLAGDQAGQVLGLALAIKMIVYVLLSPVSGAVVPPHRRKIVLIGLDVIRALVALALPFVTEIWQIYVLIAVLQSASACFTPLFQSVIPQILPDEAKYTRALSLSRLAYDLESLLSPALAAALLTVIAFQGLFVRTSAGFLLSALLVMWTTFPVGTRSASAGGPYARAIRGMKIYLRTPRLRGLLLLNLCAAAGGAMVFVNTVVVARTVLQGGEREVAWLLAAFGVGSMLVALCLPRLLDRIADRRIMLSAATAMTVVLSAATVYWFSVGGLAGRGGHLAAAGHVVRGPGNARWPTHPSFRRRRGSAVPVRRTVFPLARVLAAGVPDRRFPGRQAGICSSVGDFVHGGLAERSAGPLGVELS